MRKIVIIGSTRSGLEDTAKLFQSLGHDFRNEDSNSNFGFQSWFYVTEKVKANEVFFHQVKNPIKVISSLFNFPFNSWEFINENIKLDENYSQLQKCMKYWIEWNKKAEKKALFTFKVEELPTAIRNMFEIANLPEPNMFDINMAFYGGARNQGIEFGSDKVELTIEDMKKEDEKLFNEVVKLATKYGYTI